MAKTPTEIASLARAHTTTALRVLAGIMRERDAPPAARVMAVKELLDRGWGKAQQPVAHSGSVNIIGQLLAEIDGQGKSLPGKK